jgi:UDP-N-acetylmuramate-alanine ligase
VTGSANLSNTIKLPSKIHFIGVGGAGMSPLAGICLKNKIKVTGSDNSFGKVVQQLQDEGADIWTPHSLAELKKRDLPEVCVYSTAILPSNEEFAYLQEKGVAFWHRSDLLQKIAEQFEKQIVISGTHGKTTTTAMLIWILEKAGLKPCWVLGGVLKGLGSYGWNNDQREIFVFEGDESDQSFLKSNPYIGLVTSLEPDHLENYQNSFEVQIEKFQEFAKKSKHFICSESCKEGNLLKVAKAVYGSNLELHNLLSQQNYWYLNPENNNSISVHELGENLVDNRGQIHLENISGEHNHLNALGAITAVDFLIGNNAVNEQILKLRQKALSEIDSKDFFDYAIVNDEQANLLQNILFKATGEKLDFRNYKRCITCDEIRKIENKHGLGHEKFEDQEAISDDDYLQINEVIQNPDSVVYAGRSKSYQLNLFRYSKQLNGSIYIIEEVRSGREKLNLLSFYKKKNPRVSSEATFVMPDALPESDSPQANVQNDNNQDFNNNYTPTKYSEISKQVIQRAIGWIEDFPGIYRRFEIIGKTENNITVIDDYAHHPTEVNAAIKAGRSYLYNQKLGGKLIVAFQPHLPTRLRDLWKEFTECFEEADLLFLNDLYIARGEPIAGIDSEHLAAEIKHAGLTYVPGPPEKLINPLINKANPNDLILLLGAGDITRIRETLLENLRQKVSR